VAAVGAEKNPPHGKERLIVLGVPWKAHKYRPLRCGCARRHGVVFEIEWCRDRYNRPDKHRLARPSPGWFKREFHPASRSWSVRLFLHPALELNIRTRSIPAAGLAGSCRSFTVAVGPFPASAEFASGGQKRSAAQQRETHGSNGASFGALPHQPGGVPRADAAHLRGLSPGSISCQQPTSAASFSKCRPLQSPRSRLPSIFPERYSNRRSGGRLS